MGKAKLKPNKKYSCHLDDEYQKAREAVVSPWNYIKNNFVVTKHFVERITQRRINIRSVANILQFGKKYYIVEEDSLMIKYVYENRGVVEKDGRLITAIFFGKNKRDLELFTKSDEYFIFETD